MMPATHVVLTTLASPEAAERFVRALLERRLIACGTLLPGATSLYHWEGHVETAQETVVLLKTRAALFEPLRTAFTELHPYEVPELLALPVDAGLEAYLGWVARETTPG